MRTIWMLAISLFLLTMPCVERVARTAAPLPEFSRKCEAVGSTIKGDPTCELGHGPRITVALTNQTDADIYLVGSLDGSDCKRRYPHCYFDVTGPDGKSAVHNIGRCKFMNTLLEKDFVKVAPGKTFDPYQNIDGHGFFSAQQLEPDTFRMAGEYRIRFVYSTKSDSIFEWGGDGRFRVAADEKLVSLFRQVPKLEVTSNEIKMKVVEPGR